MMHTNPAAHRYGGFILGLELFDHSRFSLSIMEAEAMDPQQKLILERGYSSLSMAGFSMGTLQGSITGVYAAVSDIGFSAGVVSERIARSTFIGTGGACSVASGRVSYALGLHGPCVSIDTACSAGLAATHGAALSLKNAEAEACLAVGVIVSLTPHQSVFFARLSMTSKRGRCHTFDQRADGYGRCEGSSAAALGPAEEDTPVHTMLSSVGVRQDGRSASLTAPNGVAQSNLIKSVLQRSGLTKAQLSFVEAHGTGTALGDPQETGALSNVFKGNPITITSLKGNVAHTELAAGLTGLISLSSRLRQRMSATNAQLRITNEYVAAAIRQTSIHLPAQTASSGTAPENGISGGVSSFGWSGTIAHAIVSMGSSDAAPLVYAGDLFTWFGSLPALAALKRHRVTWRELPPPFTQQQLPRDPTNEVTVFRSRLEGALFDVVADHLIGGRVLMPGAGYLEMGHASARAIDSAMLVALVKTTFLQPLELGGDGASAADGVVDVRLDLSTREFRIQSGPATDEAMRSLHCTGSQVKRANAPLSAGMARHRSRAGFVLAVGEAHADGFLTHGPKFRRMISGWMSGRGRVGGDGLAGLRARTSWQGTVVHPADLDGAFQLSLLRSFASRESSDILLPYAVDESVMEEAHAFGVQGLWAAASCVDSDTHIDVQLVTHGAERVMSMLGGYRQRAAAVGGQVSSQPSFMFQVAWKEATEQLSAEEASSSATALLLSTTTSTAGNGSSHGVDYAGMGDFRAIVIGFAADTNPTLLASSWSWRALEVVRSVAEASSSGSPPEVYFFSTADVFERRGRSAPISTNRLNRSTLVGAGRSARVELQQPFKIFDVDAPSKISPAEWRNALITVAHGMSETETEMALLCSTGRLRVPRLALVPQVQSGPFRLLLQGRGAISNLVRGPLPDKLDAPVDEQFAAQLRVRAVGLNFRDVLNVLGEYPGDPGPPGGDCSGVMEQTGSKVMHLQQGMPVCGLAYAALGMRARTNGLLLALAPKGLPFEDIATLPTVWSTAHVAFQWSSMHAAHRVLIHAAVGGVGLSAIAAGHFHGLHVDSSAGRPLKHYQLRALELTSTSSSRDGTALSAGAPYVAQAQRQHMVLNSLSLDFISVTMGLLCEGGHLEEIGKRAVWSIERQGATRAKDIKCQTLALDIDMDVNPWWMGAIFEVMMARVGSGKAHGLPKQVYDMGRDYGTAFR